jgi:hypothetical protein
MIRLPMQRLEPKRPNNVALLFDSSSIGERVRHSGSKKPGGFPGRAFSIISDNLPQTC